MCIAVFRWAPQSDSPLRFIANRDEFFERPTAAMHWWPGGHVLAGRDLKNSGTWLGVTKGGRFAALTNIRNLQLRKTGARSRGELASNFLSTDTSVADYLGALAECTDCYEGFNLLCGDLLPSEGHAPSLWFLNSQIGEPQSLRSGVYGLSNATLDTPWPKVERLRLRFAALVETMDASDHDFHSHSEQLLRDEAHASEADLPTTGVPRDWERALSAIFIRQGGYGTRASTTLSVSSRQVSMREVTHAPNSEQTSCAEFEFSA